MKKMLRPLVVSIGFYIAACGIVVRVVPAQMARAGAATSASTSSAPALLSNSQQAPAPSQPSKTPAPQGDKFEIADISHHDTISNWITLKKNVSGLYTKATEGDTYVDPMLDSYTKEAQKVELPMGYFHYFWPTEDTNDAIKQADHFYNTIRPYGYTFFPALDVEESNNLSTTSVVASVRAFCNEFERISGHSLLIYCSSNFADKYLSDSSLAKYGLWVADYNKHEPGKAGTWKTHAMWQYTCTAHMDGVIGDMDANHSTSAIILH